MELFSLPFEGHVLRGDYRPGKSGREVLMIHGAGQSERGRFAGWRHRLAERGYGTTAFDCIGHGETGGALAASSLASRTRQAQAVLAERRLHGPLAVFGTSMGAYNALRLSEERPLQALVLIVPGVYTPQAWEVPFGPRFSAVIRRERSWADSDAWDIVARHAGSLLVIAAEHDAVIPMEIPQRLVASARQSCWRRLHVVRDAEHNRLFSLLQERPAELEAMMCLVDECLESGMNAHCKNTDGAAAAPDYALRPALASDREFLRRLRRATMYDHLAASGVAIDEAGQEARIDYRFDCAQIVLVDGRPAGLFKVCREGNPWELIQVQIAPEWQGRGLGARLIRDLLEQARHAGADVALSVLKANPARALYERLGFVQTGIEGAEYLMRAATGSR